MIQHKSIVRKTALSLVVMLFLLPCLKAGIPPFQERYLDSLFLVEVVSDVTYGSNTNLYGSTQSLEMDIYQPQGDTLSERPLIILAHGGSFIYGRNSAAL